MNLIDKSALVAEIEKIRAKWFGINNDFADGQKGALTDVLSLINTFEVKKVDLEKVFNDEYSKFSNDVDAMDYGFPIDLADYKDFAKHFFELGLKAQKGE